LLPNDRIILTALKIPCIIGIFDWERKQKQDVVIDIRFPADIQKAARKDRIEETIDYKRIAKATIVFVEKSGFQLIETLAERLAAYLLGHFNLDEIFLRVSKPGAVRGSQNVSVEINRKNPVSFEGLVFFSLGSNIHPASHLKNALKEMEEKYRLKAVSHVYETSPVGGKKNQPFFWNMVAAVATDEKPQAIRRWIDQLERTEGRFRTKNRYVSRTLDVDLILWKNRVLKGKGFILPHPDISQKAFVLFPLLEISPNLVLPGIEIPLIELAQSFNDSSQLIRQLPMTFVDSFDSTGR
jgi:dihydroneopterin aldolase/2-amino-4-hydroxy-6-hydroxymethyldihydropteridine diphosphokinase